MKGIDGGRRRVARLALLVGIQGLLLLVVLEVAGRLADPLGISFYPESARYFDTLTLGGEIGYRSTPGLQGRFWGAAVSINSISRTSFGCKSPTSYSTSGPAG